MIGILARGALALVASESGTKAEAMENEREDEKFELRAVRQVGFERFVRRNNDDAIQNSSLLGNLGSWDFC